MLGSNGAINSGMITDGLRARMVIEMATRCASALQIGAADGTVMSAELQGIAAIKKHTRTP